MRIRSRGVRLGACLVAALAMVAASATLATDASAASARASSIVRTAYDVPGVCSSPSGFLTNVSTTVDTMRLTISPASPRAGSKVRMKVFVQQSLRTPAGWAYPKHILQGQVVIGVGSKSHTLRSASNARAFTGVVFPKGFTAKATFKAPKKGSYKVGVRRIVYNAIGGFAGTWGTPYSGFDVVCSGGANPTVVATTYAHPRVTLKTRKHA